MGFFSFFSPYAHPFERRVNRFFTHVKSTSNPIRLQRELLELMQENLIILNLWLEKKYKNYVYLKKRVRQQMFEDVKLLEVDFLAFCEQNPVSLTELGNQLSKAGLRLPEDEPGQVRMAHFSQIMQYLRPGQRYQYQASSNFGKLLKNPQQDVLIGDCNQIVTLYAALYTLKFPLNDLEINLLPGHVCLHFRGIDIEATNATFHHYTEDVQVLPITELISTNLLDVNDSEAKTAAIDPRTMVKRAQLAYHISSFKPLVSRNLKAAYQNLVVRLLNEKAFGSALFFARKMEDPEWIKKATHAATVDALQRHDFAKAESYLQHGGDEALWQTLRHNRGVYHYKNERYKEALKDFQRTGNDEMIRACYQGLYRQKWQTVRHIKTVTQAKRYRSTYRELVALARQAGNQEAEDWAEDLLRKTNS